MWLGLGRLEMHTEFWLGYLFENIDFADKDINERSTLRLILGRQVLRMRGRRNSGFENER
jgi:hypothetical protein